MSLLTRKDKKSLLKAFASSRSISYCSRLHLQAFMCCNQTRTEATFKLPTSAPFKKHSKIPEGKKTKQNKIGNDYFITRIAFETSSDENNVGKKKREIRNVVTEDLCLEVS